MFGRCRFFVHRFRALRHRLYIGYPQPESNLPLIQKIMEKQYVVKNFLTNQYWSFDSKWGNQFEAREFNSVEEAEDFIKQLDGQFVIETIYIV